SCRILVPLGAGGVTPCSHRYAPGTGITQAAHRIVTKGFGALRPADWSVFRRVEDRSGARPRGGGWRGARAAVPAARPASTPSAPRPHRPPPHRPAPR